LSVQSANAGVTTHLHNETSLTGGMKSKPGRELISFRDAQNVESQRRIGN
jgi:hypothetical protein